MRVKVQLESAQNAEEARVITSLGFLAQLKRMLRLPEESKLDESATLVEMGVYSLLAVNVRSWFLKEVSVDVLTLKILGGGSISELVDAAMDKLVHMAANVDIPKQNDPEAQQQPPTPAHAGLMGRSILPNNAVAVSAEDPSTSVPEASAVFTPPSTPPIYKEEDGKESVASVGSDSNTY